MENKSLPLDQIGKDCKELQLQRLATAVDRHYEASQLQLGATEDYYDVRWHLRRLDQFALLAAETGKLPAAVAAQRTMMEAVGLIGPQISVDARTEILQLPEGMSEAALIALATGTYIDVAASSDGSPEIGTLD